MELVERYLHAVKFWLPKRQKLDIIAELSEDIRSQIDDRESELGRKLNEAEVGAILKQMGRPVLVANRYLPQRYLVGPVLYPVYLFVLKVVALCYVVPSVLVRLAITVGHGTATRQEWVAALLSAWASVFLTGLIAFGVITMVFSILERTEASCGGLENWDPRKLPAVRDTNRIPRVASTIELIANLVFCTWWIAGSGMLLRNQIDLGNIQITLAPVWRYFFWGYLVVALGNIVLAGMNFIRPWQTRARASMRLLSDLAGCGLFCWMMRSAIVAGISITDVPAQKTAEIANAINWWTAKSFVGAVIICGVIVAVDVYRVFRVGRNQGQQGRSLATGLPTSAMS